MTYDKINEKLTIDKTNWIIDPYERYVWGDIKTTQDYCNALQEERGDKMKLIEIYKEKSLKNINNYYDKKIKEHKESDPIYNNYQQIINEANENLKRLYNSQNHLDNLLYELEEDYNFSDNIVYVLSYNGDDEYINQIKEERKKVINSIKEKIAEAEAHIELINQFTDKNYEYTDVIDILAEYGITDEKGHITPYEIKEENPSQTTISSDTLCPKQNCKRRGRKPNKKSE